MEQELTFYQKSALRSARVVAPTGAQESAFPRSKPPLPVGALRA